MNSLHLNNPPTAVGGIGTSLRMCVCRKDLNNPPTAVGGIQAFMGIEALMGKVSLLVNSLRSQF